MDSQSNFASRVHYLVSQIPQGRVMTYGQLAALCGHAKAARIVGGIAHFGDPNLPWHRVVNKKGGLAAGYPGGREAHKIHLETEGITVHGEEDTYFVDVQELLWHPPQDEKEETGGMRQEVREKGGRKSMNEARKAGPPSPIILGVPIFHEANLASYLLPHSSCLYVVGPTSSGKSALAHKLAIKYNGAIVCADSRTIYKGMDIGTAKPTKDEQREVDYYCIDLVEPNERFTVADFKRHAEAAIAKIKSVGKLPIVVGGTGLYVDALLFDFSFRPGEFNLHEFDDIRLEVLIEKAGEYKKLTSDDRGNRRRLVRIIQTKGAAPVKKVLPKNVLVIGLMPPKEVLEERIKRRAESMFTCGVVEETKLLVSRYGWNVEAMSGTIYKSIQPYLAGEITRQEAISQCVQADKKLSKKQRTWFKRYDFVQWLDSIDGL